MDAERHWSSDPLATGACLITFKKTNREIDRIYIDEVGLRLGSQTL